MKIKILLLSLFAILTVGCASTKPVATQQTAEGDIVPTKTGVMISKYHSEINNDLQSEKDNLNKVGLMVSRVNNEIKSLDLSLSSRISELDSEIIKLKNKKMDLESRLSLLSEEKTAYFGIKAILDGANNDVDTKISASKDATENFAPVSPITGEEAICGLNPCLNTYKKVISPDFLMKEVKDLENKVKAIKMSSQ